MRFEEGLPADPDRRAGGAVADARVAADPQGAGARCATSSTEAVRASAAGDRALACACWRRDRRLACTSPGERDAGTPARAAPWWSASRPRPDSLDPAVASSPEALQALWLAHTPGADLSRARRARAGTQVVPGLAENMPEVSDDGLTWTFTLRKGLRYADGRAVRRGRLRASPAAGPAAEPGRRGAARRRGWRSRVRACRDPGGRLEGVVADARTRAGADSAQDTGSGPRVRPGRDLVGAGAPRGTDDRRLGAPAARRRAVPAGRTAAGDGVRAHAPAGLRASVRPGRPPRRDRGARRSQLGGGGGRCHRRAPRRIRGRAARCAAARDPVEVQGSLRGEPHAWHAVRRDGPRPRPVHRPRRAAGAWPTRWTSARWRGCTTASWILPAPCSRSGARVPAARPVPLRRARGQPRPSSAPASWSSARRSRDARVLVAGGPDPGARPSWPASWPRRCPRSASGPAWRAPPANAGGLRCRIGERRPAGSPPRGVPGDRGRARSCRRRRRPSTGEGDPARPGRGVGGARRRGRCATPRWLHSALRPRACFCRSGSTRRTASGSTRCYGVDWSSLCLK